MTCSADCFQDDKAIRPIASPRKLVWLYFNVEGCSSGTLESRQFSQCQCGCNNLIANPPADKDIGPSFIPRTAPEEIVTEPIKLSWLDKIRFRLCQWLCHKE